MIIDDFDTHRSALADQYENSELYIKDTGLPFEALKQEALDLADRLSGLPHPVVKARAFAFILQRARLYLNPDDWFGISLDATRVTQRLDVGNTYDKILVRLRSKWQAEIPAEQMTRYLSPRMIKAREDHLVYVMYPDYDHSTPDWGAILSLGISGLRERAALYSRENSRVAQLSDEQKAYYEGIDITYEALQHLLDRFIQQLGQGPVISAKQAAMLAALKHLRHHPPRDMYQGLLLAWLFWYIQENIEGIRVRTMGGIDGLYRALYEQDLSSGRYTREEIGTLLLYFMNAFHAFRVHYQQPIYLGGVDENGHEVVNDLSYLCLEAYNRLSAPNPKLQVVISENTPEPFVRAVADTIRRGNSSISLINRHIASTSLMRLGVPAHEALPFLMSGCWDYTVKNDETKTIPVRLSFPKVLEITLHNGTDPESGIEMGTKTGEAATLSTFPAFLEAFKRQLAWMISDSMEAVHEYEHYLHVISPASMYSATMHSSISSGRDGYAHGVKYNNTVYTLSCLATVVDSLMAIKRFVYEQGRITLPELIHALEVNWNGYESLRQVILVDEAKYGNGHAETDELMTMLSEYAASLVNGRPNSRNGYWKIGLLSIDKNVHFGRRVGATPDGRLAGQPLSRNLSPVLGMDRHGLTTLMRSVTKVDFTKFPHAAMFDVVLHPSAVRGEEGLTAFCGLLRTYFAMGGHSVQFNVLDAKVLKQAQKHPDQYRNLQIRVCGWNVYFVDLPPVEQSWIIARAEQA